MAKKNIILKNNHFVVEKVDDKEVWAFNWARIEKDVSKAIKDFEKAQKVGK